MKSISNNECFFGENFSFFIFHAPNFHIFNYFCANNFNHSK